MDRRLFLKSVGLAGAAALTAGGREARAEGDAGDPVGILVDTTRCAGCRTCEFACATANGLPEPDPDLELRPGMRREPSERQWTVVNCYETEEGDEIYVKKQCMHCLQPACASACLTKAMLKTEDGPVLWREDKCMGCRFCMVSCPFDIPKFEYGSANPRIQKCVMCFSRIREGEKPACVANCPNEALLFGKRSELLEIAYRRIYQAPDDYVHHVYGEHEAGGTGWLYLAAVPFEKLGFRTDLGKRAYPELTTGFLYSVPLVLALWPAFLLGLRKATRSNHHDEAGE